MKRVLISTVYNEAASLQRWIEALEAQTIPPDEFVIVDGGSKDNTVDLLRNGFNRGTFPKPRIIVRRCNIAEGRNFAIANSTHEIIASVDASAIPDRRWLDEITRPFQENAELGVVGGRCPMVVENALNEKIARLNSSDSEELLATRSFSPSSRNVAFTRAAWTSVGGYPEWLTLTAEDSLFNENLHAAGVPFYYQASAIVSWEGRPNLASYLRMMRSYGYGSAEASQGARNYRRYCLTTLLPPLILLSPHPLSYAPLRYLRNAAAAWGWMQGRMTGKKPPEDWQFVDGAWLSPQTVATMRDRRMAVAARS